MGPSGMWQSDLEMQIVQHRKATISMRGKIMYLSVTVKISIQTYHLESKMLGHVNSIILAIMHSGFRDSFVTMTTDISTFTHEPYTS